MPGRQIFFAMVQGMNGSCSLMMWVTFSWK
jgi:hypothetical protein